MDYLKKLLGNIRNGLLVLFFAFKDNRTPFFAKVISMLAFIYLASPLDILPDFFLPAGLLDDLAIVPAMLYLSYKTVPQEVMDDAHNNSEKVYRMMKIAFRIILACFAVSFLIFMVTMILMLRFILGGSI